MSVDSWRDLDLWDHQREAVNLCKRYFDAYRREGSTGAALVRMPTGTGKTGVMAVLARMLYKSKSSLIVTPFVSLKKQVAEEIRKSFWRKLDADVSDWATEVTLFTPSTLREDELEDGGPRKVYICTVQSLRRLREEETEKYERVKALIDFVLFDEGHREPAPSWARSVRGLGKPIVLFTATPYRNDFELFDIDERFSYSFSFQEALAGRYIRGVSFYRAGFNTPASFAERLVEYFHDEYQDQAPDGVEPRVIVRCSNKDDILKVVAALREEDETAIGIHERFSSSKEQHLLGSVPNDFDAATFWVHQYKMLEGVDEPSFALLAFYEPLSNGRSIVQQIGRVLRNPERLRGQTAVVFYPEDRDLEAVWERYLDFEKHYEVERQDLENVLRENLSAQLPALYLDGDYRRRFRIGENNIYEKIDYPTSTNVFRCGDEFDIEDLIQGINESGERENIVAIKKENPRPLVHFWIYVTSSNSRYLLEEYFLEFDLGFILLKHSDDLLFFFDSRGRMPKYLKNNAESLSPRTIAHLFSGDQARASALSLRNTDIGRHSVRRRSVHAFSIEETAPNLTDHAFYCSTIRGYAESKEGEPRHRYLGFTNGRVTDNISGTNDFDAYMEWLSAIEAAIRGKERAPIPLLQRYAQQVEVPDDPAPRHVLLDLDEVADRYVTREGGSRSVLSI